MTFASQPPIPEPFPELEFDGLKCWSFREVLSSWAGFQSREGPYGSQDRRDPSDGSVEISK
jgi:hypothetical protein